MSNPVTREEFDELRSQFVAFVKVQPAWQQEAALEPEKYRRFWERAWPKTLAALAIGTGILSIGTVFIVKLARRLHETAQLAAIKAMFNELFDVEHTKQRRFIYTELSRDPSRACSDEWNVVNEVVNSFEIIGYMVNSKLLSEFHAVNVCHVSAVRVWYKLLPYIHHVRNGRGEDTEHGRFASYFQLLATACQNEWKRRGLTWPPRYY